jgi:hypothetical protein
LLICVIALFLLFIIWLTGGNKLDSVISYIFQMVFTGGSG